MNTTKNTVYTVKNMSVHVAVFVSWKIIKPVKRSLFLKITTATYGIPLWISWYDLVTASLNCGIQCILYKDLPHILYTKLLMA
jgi:hypothetical protein